MAKYMLIMRATDESLAKFTDVDFTEALSADADAHFRSAICLVALGGDGDAIVAAREGMRGGDGPVAVQVPAAVDGVAGALGGVLGLVRGAAGAAAGAAG